jgi:tripartite-type tricarboxylate transporter receptor subunit TctC
VISFSAWICGSLAADFPAKPLRLVVPYPPGGLLDNLGRALSPGLATQLGQPVVVENRPGAAGMIGAASESGPRLRSPQGLRAGQHGEPRAAHPRRQALVQLGRRIGCLAKADPGKLSYGTPGNGNPNHVAGELFKSAAGLNIVHVPPTRVRRS